jgi:hypothetical protein
VEKLIELGTEWDKDEEKELLINMSLEFTLIICVLPVQHVAWSRNTPYSKTEKEGFLSIAFEAESHTKKNANMCKVEVPCAIYLE